MLAESAAVRAGTVATRTRPRSPRGVFCAVKSRRSSEATAILRSGKSQVPCLYGCRRSTVHAHTSYTAPLTSKGAAPLSAASPKMRDKRCAPAKGQAAKEFVLFDHHFQRAFDNLRIRLAALGTAAATSNAAATRPAAASDPLTIVMRTATCAASAVCVIGTKTEPPRIAD